MPRALILGGTGLIGRATALRLLGAGWRVDVTGRDPSHLPTEIVALGGRFIAADRSDAARSVAALGAGADLLVDCLCNTAQDARHLLPLAADAGSTVMISTKAVYVDDAGHHANSSIPPHFAEPIRESQPTMAPADTGRNTGEGYGANKVAAEQVLLDSGRPVTVIRPSKVHGRGAQRPREWVFVKRVLDGRPAVFLNRRGTGVDHPTAAANIAALIETVAASPGSRILNCADPDAPNGLQISRVIAKQLAHHWDEVLLEPGVEVGVGVAVGVEADGALGRHPWDACFPIVLDMTAAKALGYYPAGDYASTVADEVQWLVEVAVRGESAQLPTGLDAAFFESMFDYRAEDEYLQRHRR